MSTAQVCREGGGEGKEGGKVLIIVPVGIWRWLSQRFEGSLANESDNEKFQRNVWFPNKNDQINKKEGNM